MVRYMEPMNRFHCDQADNETSHKRADHGTIAQLEVHEVPDAYGDNTA